MPVAVMNTLAGLMSAREGEGGWCGVCGEAAWWRGEGGGGLGVGREWGPSGDGGLVPSPALSGQDPSPVSAQLWDFEKRNLIFWEVGHRGSCCDVFQRVFCLCSPLGVL